MKTRNSVTIAGVLGAALVIAGALAQDTKPGGDEWVTPARAARKQNPIPADSAKMAKGKELYEMACFACHGLAGKGDGSAAASLERNGAPIRPGNLSEPKLWEQSDGTLFWKISEGRTPMPAFQESFSEEDRWAIVIYVRSLAPKPTLNAQAKGNP
ncbi:MAG: c-type cytochrome [Verrucomicrobia bacterium]|nr:c-type cytochrome [Verrucomicrobiota bacterium]